MPIDNAIGADAPALQEDYDILNDETDDSGGDGEETKTPPAKGEEDEALPTPEEGEGGEDVDEVDKIEGEEEEKEEKDEEKDTKIEVGLAKQVKAKYPNLFKEFPELRRSMYRDQQYSELIPTVEEAKDLVEKAQVFDEYERRIVSGDPSILLDSLGKTSDESLTKFAMNFLPAVGKLSPELRGRMIFPYLRNILTNAQNDARSSGNKNLSNSISHLSRYLWNSTEIPQERAEPKIDDHPEVKRLREKNEQFEAKTKEEFETRVFDNGLSQFKSTVDQTFKDLGKKDERFTKMELRAMAADTLSKVRQALDRDPRHARAMQNLWLKARNEGFPQSHGARLVNTFLAGAKNMLPSVRAKVVADALKEKGLVTTPKGEQKGGPQSGGPAKGGKVVSSKEIDYSTTSDEDILSGDSTKIKLKKAK